MPLSTDTQLFLFDFGFPACKNKSKMRPEIIIKNISGRILHHN